ncbi:type II secretion system F family protein [Vibrio caribbeanicus]|uniref:type II secretion system F family protein n=1 Tax=Vibrio caribbeanicus TaxID=701175 RepID=UPI0022848A60|nr:type II secretion system F family protein [Vibrio caribbeanicus]MCY9845596.1 type II secretion system F family protein [Vibrio caribbeanicus]
MKLISVIICVIMYAIFFIFYRYHRNKNRKEFLDGSGLENKSSESEASLFGLGNIDSIYTKMVLQYKLFTYRLGPEPKKKIAYFILITFVVGYWSAGFFSIDILAIMPITFIAFSIAFYIYVNNAYKKEFRASFPDAINMLASAIKAGESLVGSLNYVAQVKDDVVGKELKWVADRLVIGETPAQVFETAKKRNTSFKEYGFFLSALKINVEKGGQLTDIIKRIDRIIFNAHAMEKKKFSMTSEARLSAKIVGSLPFIFLIMMRYMSPENYDYVFETETGNIILYYVVISELIGMGIIQMLMRSVK